MRDCFAHKVVHADNVLHTEGLARGAAVTNRVPADVHRRHAQLQPVGKRDHSSGNAARLSTGVVTIETCGSGRGATTKTGKPHNHKHTARRVRLRDHG